MTRKKTEKAKKTENQNKKTLVAYKGFDKNFKCRDFQYAVGQKYTHEGPVEVCISGFHACRHPLDVFAYYSPAEGRFAVVEQSGRLNLEGLDTKVASRHIHIKYEIGIPDLVEATVEYVASRCEPLDADSPASATKNQSAASTTRKRGAASATGNRSAATAMGDCGAASATGYRSTASATGDRGTASTTGYQGAASATGDQSAASATEDQSAAAATGYRGAALATGDRGAAAATGIRGAASATGDCGAASATGYRGAASATGDQSAATATGNRSAALATGYQGTAAATGQHAVALAAGGDGSAKGRKGCALFLVYRSPNDGSILHAKALIVGKNGIKPDTWYRLNSSGKVERVD